MLEQSKHQRYGRCLVERVIGRGARSTVYLAWHEAFQIPVAVKVMRKAGGAEDAQFSERFLREARIAAQLTHPNIVRVYDCGETDNSHYLVLEYIEGETCRDKLERWGAFDWQRAVQIVCQAADGLQYASKKGIIHRDLKPENIMIDGDGNVRIADLGLAKEVLPGQSSATADGDVLGTPYYMSPEQIRQPSQVDFRSDIYSMGATLYHLATGQVPFEAPTPFEIMTRHLNDPLPSPLDAKPDLPAALCDVIERAMRKDPANRYQTYSELIRDMEALLEDEPAVDLGAEPQVEAEEEALAPGPAPEAAGKPSVPERPLRAVDLALTDEAMLTKVLGVAALLIQVAFVVFLSHFALTTTGLGWAGRVAAVVAIALAVTRGRAILERRDEEGEGEVSHRLERRLTASLGRLSERLELAVPRLRIQRRNDAAVFAYSLFSRAATIYLPGPWLRAARLTDGEADALLAQSMAGIYAGDSDVRTLLAVPVAVLSAGSRFVAWLAGAIPKLRPRLRLRLAQGAALSLLVIACGLVAVLFVLSVWAGLLGLLFLAVLALTAGFERHSQFAADALAVEVTQDETSVKKMVVLAGLAGVEAYQFVRESMGKASAETLPRPPALPPQGRGIVPCVIAHYNEVEHVPGSLESAGMLFSPTPLAAERLNRLAGVPGGRSTVVIAASAVGAAFRRMLGASPRHGTAMVELGRMGSYSLMGGATGLLAVLALAVFSLFQVVNAIYFYVVLAVLAVGAGMAASRQAFRAGDSPGRLAWACAAASVAFSAASMLGFCLVGGPIFDFALQLPSAFLAVLLPMALGAMAFTWLAKALGMEAGRWPYEDPSKTAHTVILLNTGERLVDDAGEPK
jgi:tRNA A-37 threonylcarbamoyl transferase component Bud32